MRRVAENGVRHKAHNGVVAPRVATLKQRHHQTPLGAQRLETHFLQKTGRRRLAMQSRTQIFTNVYHCWEKKVGAFEARGRGFENRKKTKMQKMETSPKQNAKWKSTSGTSLGLFIDTLHSHCLFLKKTFNIARFGTQIRMQLTFSSIGNILNS